MTYGNNAYANSAFGDDGGFQPDNPSPIPSVGWKVVVTHPTTGRRLEPDILDEPVVLPSLNSLPKIRVPVRKSSIWLEPTWVDNPNNATMKVWLDGVRQPIDELLEVEDRTDRTVLVGVGGVELRDRVSVEYREEERHVAAQNLITSETTYGEDVDTPSFNSNTDKVFQDPTTTAEFDGDLSIDSTDPVNTSNDEVTIYQTCFIEEAETESLSGADIFNASRFSGNGPTDGNGRAVRIDADNESVTQTFTLDYEMSDPKFAVRVEGEGNVGEQPEIDWFVNGTNIGTYSPATTGVVWETDLEDTAAGGSSIDSLSSGDNTFKAEATSSGTEPFYIDLMAPYDNQFSYTFDDSLTTGSDGGRYLDGPGTRPEQGAIVNGARETTAFSVIAATADITIDDSTGDQFLQVSNNGGGDWFPDDGTEDNTTSVDVTFSTTGASIRVRFKLDAISPNGTRDETPRENYDAQTVSDYTLKGDIEFKTLLIDEKFDNSLVSILNEIATNRYLWSVNRDASGTYQVSWTRPGSRTAASDPDLGNVTITKNIDTVDKITIKGSSIHVVGERFTASSSFTALNNNSLTPGEEVVHDGAGTNFTRADDYEMDYSAGAIRTVAGSAMSDGTTYEVNYDFETEGSHPTGVSNPAREFVDTVPGVTSDRNAEQIAFALYDGEAENPLYSGDISIPQFDARFDPLDAFSLANLDLPSEATPLEVRGEPEITPRGLTVRLGSRPRIEEALQPIAQTVEQLSRRS